MPYTIEHNGIKLTLPTYEEAIKAMKDLAGKAAVDAPAPEKQLSHVADESVSVETAKDAVKLLQHLRNNPNGVGHETIQRLWGVASPKGLGPKTGAVERLLGIYSFPEGSVFTRDKTPNGRVWKPGKQIEDAIYALEAFIRLI